MGTINGTNNAGGIIGTTINAVTPTITNCYTVGSTGTTKGYIIGNSSANPSLTTNFAQSYPSGTSTGWNTTNANTVLLNTPTGSFTIGTSWSVLTTG